MFSHYASYEVSIVKLTVLLKLLFQKEENTRSAIYTGKILPSYQFIKKHTIYKWSASSCFVPFQTLDTFH